MFIIQDKKATDITKAYLSVPDVQAMVHMTDKEHAKQFETKIDAKAFIRDYKWRLADFNIQRLKDLIISEA